MLITTINIENDYIFLNINESVFNEKNKFFIKLKKAIFLAPFEYKKKPGMPGFFLSFFDRRNLKDTVTYPRKVFKYVFSNYLKIPMIAMPIAIRTSNMPCMI